jgi:transglutaminase-like putative cysteine protease
MRYLYTLLLMLLMVLSTQAQQNYAVSLIPKELLSHASAVVRDDETTVEVKDMSSVICHFTGAVTVLNKNGDKEAKIIIWHNKSRQIRYIKGTLYNEFGMLMGKFSERDFDDQSVGDGSLFDDTRIKRYQPAITTYPYTIAYDYEINSKQSLVLDDWSTGQSVGTSVEHSSYKLSCKPDFNIRYKEINFPGKVITAEAQGLKTYSWSMDNLKALRDEPYSPDDAQLVTSVKIAPEKFTYGSISGSFTNWNEYGKWIYDKLLKDRRQLPPETIAHIKEITAGVADPKQKAKIIYEYMQQKTRYVSVQIGIGGYQPFLASDVDQLGYGDCKALVNYTQSLLSVAGINSYYVTVMAGSEKGSALPDFASMNQFDHIILCLPFKNDTTWLECTNQQIPFGYLGDFTDDRNVVACTPEGGKLMHTPVYKTTNNRQTRKATFNLTGSGELSGEMTTKFEGLQYDNRDQLVNEGHTEQIKALKEMYPIENLNIQSFDLKQDKSVNPVTTETIKLQARDYIAQNGGRYFFIPNMGSRYIRPYKNVINRVNPVYIDRGYLDVDEINYTLPEGYKVTTQPLNVSIDKPFGRYTASTQIIGNKLVYKRSLQINDGTYSKDIYQDVVDFYQSVYEADNYTMTMEKNVN